RDSGRASRRRAWSATSRRSTQRCRRADRCRRAGLPRRVARRRWTWSFAGLVLESLLALAQFARHGEHRQVTLERRRLTRRLARLALALAVDVRLALVQPLFQHALACGRIGRAHFRTAVVGLL